MSGSLIIISGTPIGALLGIDTTAFGLQKKNEVFAVRDVPSGAHFIWGGSSAGSLRNGFWIISKNRPSDQQREICMLQWDVHTETLIEVSSVEEVHDQKDALVDLDDEFQPYDFASSKIAGVMQPGVWDRLTSCINGALLTKMTGQKSNHWKVSSSHDIKSSHHSSAIDDEDSVLSFVFPTTTRTFTTSSVGRTRTEQAQDTSFHINTIILEVCTNEDSNEIVGELQFCFVTGMILGNVVLQEQWGHIVKTVFKAYRLALDDPVFYVKFIEAFLAQLIYDEEGIDGSILDHDPTLAEDLRMILTIFKSRLNEHHLSKGANLSTAQTKVGEAFELLEKFLLKWNWDLRGDYIRSGKIQLEDGEFIDASLTELEAEDERGEYAPQVIELDEEGREKGLFSF